MKRILTLLIILTLFTVSGCIDEFFFGDQSDEGMSSSISGSRPKSDDLYSKYKFDCAKLVDHQTFDYNMQQAKIQECYDACCEGKYCPDCQWPGDSDCYAECESGKPEGTCVNCDGVCWEKGRSAFLDNKIKNC